MGRKKIKKGIEKKNQKWKGRRTFIVESAQIPKGKRDRGDRRGDIEKDVGKVKERKNKRWMNDWMVMMMIKRGVSFSFFVCLLLHSFCISYLHQRYSLRWNLKTHTW